jgi:GAF domain-containing protein
MSNMQPDNHQGQSFAQRARRIWMRLITPHPSIKITGEFRRAQLLSIVTLILTVFLIGAVLSRPSSSGIFVALIGVTIASYFFSKTRYFRWGTYIFSYVFTALGYISIYQGTANSIETSIASTVHIALIISSVLLSQRGFLALAILSSIATFTAPLYSHTSVTELDSVGRTGGIVLVLGAVLYGVQVYRANLEKKELDEVIEANRELEDVKANLEGRINVRTLELENANRQVQERVTRLQLISEISREIASSVEQTPKELLNGITHLISEKLGFYHVGIFLIDENREFAVLRAANSEGGQRMLERHHQLKVGGTGIVGYVSQGGLPRIALDAGSDAVFFNNPDLPKTRSEIALPLKYGSKIIGVLDVQSTLPFAFKDEEINFLSTLTDQIAVILNNLLVTERGGVYATRQNQSQFRGAQQQIGYSYLPDGTISSASIINDPAVSRARETGEIVTTVQPSKNNPSVLIIPVKFRDQVIGVIHIEATEADRKWTDDEITVVQSIADRAAFALENARLLEETSRRADQEATIAKVTAQIGASTDFNLIMQTTVQELGRVLGASRSFIQLAQPSKNGKGNAAGHTKSVNTAG